MNRTYRILAFVFVLGAALLLALLLQIGTSQAAFFRADDPQVEPIQACQTSIEFGFGLSGQANFDWREVWPTWPSIPVTATITLSDTGEIVATGVFTADRISPTLNLSVTLATRVEFASFYYGKTDMTSGDPNYVSGTLPLNGNAVVRWQDRLPVGTVLKVTVETGEKYGAGADFEGDLLFPRTTYPDYAGFDLFEGFVVQECPPYDLVVDVEPAKCAGCSVERTPKPSESGGLYLGGTLVRLDPVAPWGWSFSHWQGQDSDRVVEDADGTWWLRMEGQRQVTAVFERGHFPVFMPLALGNATPVFGNRPPKMPADPSPADDATDRSVDVTLKWSGGDSDGNDVTYDVYLATGGGLPSERVCAGLTKTRCDPGPLNHETRYSWRVTSWDEHGAYSLGPVWEFDTAPPPVWQEVGTASASGGGVSDNSGESRNPSLAIDPDGLPVLAWSDDGNGNFEIYARSWDGTAWVELGTGSASGGGISNNVGDSRFPSLAVSASGRPYAAWQDLTSGDDAIYVRHRQGDLWQEVGSGSANGSGIGNGEGTSKKPSLATAPDGTPYLAWSDDSSGWTQIYVRRWSSGVWQMVGAESASGGGLTNNKGESTGPSLAIAPDGTPYVSWTDTTSGNPEIYVLHWNGSAWVEVGTGPAIGGGLSSNSGESRSSSLAVTPDGTPYVAWRDNSTGNYEIYVRRWLDGVWQEVGAGSAGGGGISDNSGQSKQPSLAIAPDGTPYVAWQDDTSGQDQIYLRRWSGESWVEVGAGSASGGGLSDSNGKSTNPSLAITPDGRPHLAWQEDVGGNLEIYILQRK